MGVTVEGKRQRYTFPRGAVFEQRIGFAGVEPAIGIETVFEFVRKPGAEVGVESVKPHAPVQAPTWRFLPFLPTHTNLKSLAAEPTRHTAYLAVTGFLVVEIHTGFGFGVGDGKGCKSVAGASWGGWRD